MEEYFPPIGTDHQILEGQEAGFSLNRFAILLGGGVLLVLIGIVSFFLWQKRVAFSIPDTELSALLPKNAQHELKTGTLFSLPSDWKKTIPESRSTLILGGDTTKPTWLLAPIWVRLPSSFKTIERHGFYRLSRLNGEKSSNTFPLSFHTVANWTDPLKEALGAFRLNAPSTEMKPVFFAWNRRIIKSSLPFETQGTLSDRDEVSYALQQNSFDSLFLHSVQVNGQGLSPWRKELTRVSWTGSETNRSWELEFSSVSSSAIPLLRAAVSSTSSDLMFLPDGSAARIYIGDTTVATSTRLRLGALPDLSSVVCPTLTFKPFLRLRGELLTYPLPVPFLEAARLRVFEAGSLDGFLSACFE